MEKKELYPFFTILSLCVCVNEDDISLPDNCNAKM